MNDLTAKCLAPFPELIDDEEFQLLYRCSNIFAEFTTPIYDMSTLDGPSFSDFSNPALIEECNIDSNRLDDCDYLWKQLADVLRRIEDAERRRNYEEKKESVSEYLLKAIIITRAILIRHPEYKYPASTWRSKQMPYK